MGSSESRTTKWLSELSNTLKFELNKLLLQYRKITHCQTTVSPSMLLLNRKISFWFDLIQLNLNNKINDTYH